MPSADEADSSNAPTPLTNIDSPDPSEQHAGKKRKVTSTVARSVASLTPEQLAKKRANDRVAQRAIRERTKNQIEKLEQRIQELESQQPYQELQATIREKEAIQEENNEIRRRLASVVNTLQPLVDAQRLADLASGVRADYESSQRVPAFTGHNLHTHHNLSSRSPSTVPQQPSPQDLPDPQRQWTPHSQLNDQSWTTMSSDDGQRNDLHTPGHRMPLDFLLDGTNINHRLARVPNLHQGISNSPSTSSLPTSQPSTYQTSDIPPFAVPCRNIAPTCPLDTILLDFLHASQRDASRGVPPNRLVGPAYPSIASLLNPSISSHPLSKLFTDILSKFPDISGLPEKIAVLYAMFLLMRWQIQPTQENYDRLPEWLCPRPSQIFRPHPVWVDYLPWPRMRDRLVADYESCPLENFFVPYTTTLSLNWPYEETDTLLSSAASDGNDKGQGLGDHAAGDLIINPVFERHLRDLRNWSLGPEFVKAHPTLTEGVRIKPEDRCHTWSHDPGG